MMTIEQAKVRSKVRRSSWPALAADVRWTGQHWEYASGFGRGVIWVPRAADVAATDWVAVP